MNLTANQRVTTHHKSHLFLNSWPNLFHCTMVKLVMLEAGIDLSLFKAHSTKSPAVYCVPLAGLSVDEIAKLEDWSNVMTFFKYYKKEVDSSSHESFVQKSVLSLS